MKYFLDRARFCPLGEYQRFHYILGNCVSRYEIIIHCRIHLISMPVYCIKGSRDNRVIKMLDTYTRTENNEIIHSHIPSFEITMRSTSAFSSSVWFHYVNYVTRWL